MTASRSQEDRAAAGFRRGVEQPNFLSGEGHRGDLVVGRIRNPLQTTTANYPRSITWFRALGLPLGTGRRLTRADVIWRLPTKALALKTAIGLQFNSR